MNTKKCRFILIYILLALLFIFMFFLNLAIGSVHLEPNELFKFLFRASKNEDTSRILLQIRLPRLLTAAILGGALSVSGCLLQNFFSNPIAGPFVLGISSGAKLAVALTMILFLKLDLILNSYAMILAAFLGSMLSMGFILSISVKTKQMSLLIVCGIMIGYICSAITDFIVTFADDANIVNLHNWSQGSFSGTSWNNVLAMLLVVGFGMFSTIFLLKPMNAYQFGEAYAKNLGVPIFRFRICLILTSSILSACVAAFAGPISFVGVAVPHIVRKLFQTNRPGIIVSASFLAGATFCLFCDWIARTIFAPTELSISSVTALFGAPIVIWLMLSRQIQRKED